MRKATLAGLASPGSLGRARGSAASSKAAPRAARARGECAGCGPPRRRATCLASTRDAPVPALFLLFYPGLGSAGATRLRGARCSSSARPRRRRRAAPRACSLERGPAVRPRHRPWSRRRWSSPWGALGRRAKVRSSSSQLARPSLANDTHVQVGATGAAGPRKRQCCSRDGRRRTAPGQSAWVPLAMARACRVCTQSWSPSKSKATPCVTGIRVARSMLCKSTVAVRRNRRVTAHLATLATATASEHGCGTRRSSARAARSASSAS
jgi:hypothetical protein